MATGVKLVAVCKRHPVGDERKVQGSAGSHIERDDVQSEGMPRTGQYGLCLKYTLMLL